MPSFIRLFETIDYEHIVYNTPDGSGMGVDSHCPCDNPPVWRKEDTGTDARLGPRYQRFQAGFERRRVI